MTAPLDARQRTALAQAAHWCARLQSETAGPADQEAWHAWLNAEPVNHWAWQQAERLQQRLQRMPSHLTGRALDLADHAHIASRRSVLRGIALLLGGGVVGWAGYQQSRSQHWLADYRSAVGQRVPLTLADGSQVQLNTDSALDVQYDTHRRLLMLRQGEIMVDTAADAAGRPLFVQTPQGRIRALGTRFSVRLDGEHTQVAVYEHRVQVTPRRGEATLLDAGQQGQFDLAACARQALESSQGAWSQGLLIANDQRLGDFLSELERYRPGWLRCDPAVADLRLSGTFRLDNTDQALRALSSALPVRIEAHTRYWITVRPV